MSGENSAKRVKSSKGFDHSSSDEDKISELPDHVLHRILSLTDAHDTARTSALSHRWYNLWWSFPEIKLEEERFKNREEFMQCLRTTLRRHTFNHLEKFRLRIFLPGNRDLYEIIDMYMDRVSSDGTLKELEVGFDSENGLDDGLYMLPRKTFFSCSFLVFLRVEGCRLVGCDVFKLPVLKSLYVKNVVANEQILQELARGCPVVENLSLKNISGLKYMRLCHPKVKNLVVEFFIKVNSLELDVPCAQSIKYRGPYVVTDEESSHIEYSNCYKIQAPCCKILQLKSAIMKSTTLDAIVSMFPSLETLDLIGCNISGRIGISRRNLISLEIRECVLEEEVNIVAPDLETLFLSWNSRGARLYATKFDNLICIYLSGIRLDETLWVNDAKHPNLQWLHIISCSNVKKVRIIASKLKSLKLSNCVDLEECRVVAFKLVSFVYSGNQLVRIPHFLSSRNLQVILCLGGRQNSFRCYGGALDHARLAQFLQVLNNAAKHMKIRMVANGCTKCLSIIENSRKITPVI